MKIIIGIDNGVTGGLCAMGDDGSIIAMTAMPTQKTKRGNEVNVAAVKIWLQDLGEKWLDMKVWIEEPAGSQSAKAAASMSASFGALRGAFAWAAISFERVNPKTWQKMLLGKVEPGKTKAVALTKARELWPQEKWLATSRCEKPHDGLIDAALIAEYARRTFKP